MKCSPVSIPQSEFCPLGLMGEGRSLRKLESFNSSVGILSVGTKAIEAFYADTVPVSIPQSEFCPLGQIARICRDHGPAGFQFLSRNSVR